MSRDISPDDTDARQWIDARLTRPKPHAFYFGQLTPAQTLHNVRRVGRFDWVGGYTHAVVLDDGEVLCPWCVKPHYREISWATRHGEANGWQATGVMAMEGADDPVHCAHCGRHLDGPDEVT